MKIGALRLWPYAVALREPWRSAVAITDRRVGWLVRVESTDGAYGWGESAVMPEAGTETAMEAAAALDRAVAVLPGRRLEDAWRVLPGHDRPAARCGLEEALLDLEARYARLPLHAWLRNDSRSTLRVNASCGPVDADLADRLAAAAANGFEVAKIKLATGTSPNEWPLLRDALACAPVTLELRLDVNRAWDESAAVHRLPELTQWRVECIEEPLRGAHPLALARLQAMCGFALALDESLTQFGDAPSLPVRRQILKPMVLGGPSRALELATRRRVQSVVTSTLETAVGLWHAAHLAAAIDAIAEVPLAHGLDTGDRLERALGVLPARCGRWPLGGAPGIGIEPELP